ncbi:MAG TPA: NAD(P)/FAD-dependent oxidoreductase [Acidimicrobiales bacterium]|jgi:dihydrolipoamide dehydrogenase|nr:NAD(P)/FAD-dependent oxidoreductase [Acidimicrobiales bacterium]
MDDDVDVANDYDVIVIGAGPTGENVAARAVRGGCSAVIVESDLVGGECSYWACMPSKALLRPVAALGSARAVGGSREAVTGSLDMDAVWARRDGFTSHWHDDGQVSWLEGAGVDLVRGHGRLGGPRRVEVAGPDGTATVLTARHAVAVCTGTAAAVPASIPGLADAKPWTSREATSAKEVPARLAILGGGVVACEMATAFAAFGSRVTILERGGHLLGGVEAFAGEAVASALGERGADVRTGAEVAGVERAADGTVRVTLASGEALDADQVLAALGRVPATSDLGLDTIAGEGGRSPRPGAWIDDVDESMRVRGIDGGWLYSVGDVNHRALLTHMGKYQGRVCGDAIAARARGELGDGDAPPWSGLAATADHGAVPQVIFTEPEVAAVGLTEAAARQRGLDVRAVSYDIGEVSGAALVADGYQGRAMLVADTDRQVVVGATFVGAGVGELLHAATIAVVGEVAIGRLWHAVPSYPTMSEIWLRLLEEWGC